MLNAQVINEIRKCVEISTLAWADFNVDNGAGSFRMEYGPLADRAWILIEQNGRNQNAIALTVCPAMGRMRRSASVPDKGYVGGPQSDPLLPMFRDWLAEVRREVSAVDALKAAEEERLREEELVAPYLRTLEANNGPVPEERFKTTEYADAIQMIGAVKEQLDQLIQGTGHDERKARDDLEMRVRRLEVALPVYTKRRFITQLMQLIATVGTVVSKSDDLLKNASKLWDAISKMLGPG